MIRPLLACVAAACAVGIPSAVSHEGATGIVAERMRDMEQARKATRKIKAMLLGRIELDYAEAARLGREIAAHGERIPSLFPDTVVSRSDKMTEALPTVWSRSEEFEKRASDTVLAASRLAAAAAVENRVMLSRELKTLARTCKTCHDDYRKE